MQANQTTDALTRERAESFLTIMRNLMDKLYAGDEPLVSPDSDNPMQDLMGSPAKDEVLALLKLVTWNAVQRVLPMLKGPGQVDPALLGLDRATVRLKPGNVAEYRLKPGRLITRWVEERGQYKIDEFDFKVNWFWVIWNWRTVRELRRQRAAAAPELG